MATENRRNTTTIPASSRPRRALVLGGGGMTGTAWTAGLVAGLRAGGLDLTDTDLMVGTSAGAIVAALLATGADPADLADPPNPSPGQALTPTPDPAALARVFAVLGDPALDRADARRRAGALAVELAPITEREHLVSTRTLLNDRIWPDRRLLVTAVDADTGERRAFDRTGPATLVTAVAASIAMPATRPPITIHGRRYIDGGLWSHTNADLAAGADRVVVMEPLARRIPPSVLRAELATLDLAPEAVQTFAPDAESLTAMGADFYDRSAWRPSYDAGYRQAAAAR